MITDNKRYQKAFREFASTNGWTRPHGLTLTMKQGLMEGATFRHLDQQEASKNMRFFLNRLNKRVYGNAAVRNDKRVYVIPTIEGGNEKHIHYHAIIDCPRDNMKKGYGDLLNSIWLTTPWGRRQTHIDAEIDEGWKLYISKLNDKPDYKGFVDWENYNNIDC